MTSFPKVIAAVERSEVDQWQIADAVLQEVGPVGETGVANGTSERLMLCAAELDEMGHDFAPSTLRRYRDTAVMFPPAARPKGVPWSVFTILTGAGHPEWLPAMVACLAGENPDSIRPEVRDRIRQRGRIAISDVHGNLGKPKYREPARAEDEMGAARRVLLNSRSAKELMSDPKVRDGANRAILDSIRDNADLANPNRAGAEDLPEPDGETSAAMGLVAAVMTARRNLKAGLKRWDGEAGAELSDEWRDALTDQLDRLEADVKMFRQAATSHVTDADLASFLAAD